MGKKYVHCLLLGLVLMSLAACSVNDGRTRKTEVLLQSPFRTFGSSDTAQSKLSSSHPTAPLDLSADLTQGFTIRFLADIGLPTAEQVLLEVPKILKVSLRQHNPEEWIPQNYPAYKMSDGSVPVMEASLSLQSAQDPDVFRDLTVGIPLALLDKPEGKHEIVLQFTGVQWSLYVDGRLYDNDFALGYPSADRIKSW